MARWLTPGSRHVTHSSRGSELCARGHTAGGGFVEVRTQPSAGGSLPIVGECRVFTDTRPGKIIQSVNQSGDCPPCPGRRATSLRVR
jgi:hypothetical protein